MIQEAHQLFSNQLITAVYLTGQNVQQFYGMGGGSTWYTCTWITVQQLLSLLCIFLLLCANIQEWLLYSVTNASRCLLHTCLHAFLKP